MLSKVNFNQVNFGNKFSNQAQITEQKFPKKIPKLIFKKIILFM